MKRKLSNWSKPGERPPCVGVWETHQPTDDGVGGLYNYWNSRSWGGSELSPQKAYLARRYTSSLKLKTTRFRGLAEKPE